MNRPPSAEPPTRPRRFPAWSWVALGAILIFDVWLRGHTFSPEIRDRLGLDLWPVHAIAGEPIDCDEAVYAYVGRRLGRGDVLYRDLTEPKPPGGYWLYAAAVAVGGDTEWTVRVLAIPLVLGTIAGVWWVAGRLAGPGAGLLAAATYAVASTDPSLFGNGSNLEHPMNLASIAALIAWLVARDRAGRSRSAWLFAAGAAIGLGGLFKQVAALNAIVLGVGLLLPGRDGRRWADRLADLAAFAGGGLAIVGLAATVLIAQGAGRAAFDEVVVYARAMARDTPADPKAPPALLRWITGNADPSGEMPPPFGRTDYLVWWGRGTWPLWLLAVPATLRLLASGDPARRWVGLWTLSAWVQVFLPRLFWPHYYLLPLPGLAIAVALMMDDALKAARSGPRRWLGRIGALLTGLALLATLGLHVRDYLLVPPVELTVRFKGGLQWVALRATGRDLARKTATWDDPSLFVWGWQSPLFVYSGLDGPSRHFFGDPLMKAFANDPAGHPLIAPRLERILADLRARPPSLIFAGDPPFPGLMDFLEKGYVRAGIGPPDGRGLWVEQSHAAGFLGGNPAG